jgi:hypothetical protein
MPVGMNSLPLFDVLVLAIANALLKLLLYQEALYVFVSYSNSVNGQTNESFSAGAER